MVMSGGDSAGPTVMAKLCVAAKPKPLAAETVPE